VPELLKDFPEVKVDAKKVRYAEPSATSIYCYLQVQTHGIEFDSFS